MAITEGTYNGDWLAWEQEAQFSREQITIGASQTIVKGTVLGIETATGHYVAFNQDNSPAGSNAPVGISLGDYTVGVGVTAQGAAIVRDALVIEDHLTFPADIEAAEQVTAMAALNVLGIIARTEV